MQYESIRLCKAVFVAGLTLAVASPSVADIFDPPSADERGAFLQKALVGTFTEGDNDDVLYLKGRVVSVIYKKCKLAVGIRGGNVEDRVAVVDFAKANVEDLPDGVWVTRGAVISVGNPPRSAGAASITFHDYTGELKHVQSAIHFLTTKCQPS